mmetsp:Transcript_233/g.378  ORF Transcript_233/g.378 Transcript_233/m.378 type:complete len:100 (-) Transcript_233:1031-1330(-)
MNPATCGTAQQPIGLHVQMCTVRKQMIPSSIEETRGKGAQGTMQQHYLVRVPDRGWFGDAVRAPQKDALPPLLVGNVSQPSEAGLSLTTLSNIREVMDN